MAQPHPDTRRVRKCIVDAFVAAGIAPDAHTIGQRLGLSREQVLQAFRELAQFDTFAIERNTENVRILSPFSNLPTPFRVSVDGRQRWHAVCGAEALAMTYLFAGRVVRTDAYCRDCGDAIVIEMRDGAVLRQEPAGLLLHLGVPVARWFEDLPYA